MIEIRHATITGGGTVQSAYNEFFQQRAIRMRDSFYLWLLELVGAQPSELIIDVACGNGRLVELAAQRHLPAIGFDLSFAGIQAAAHTATQAGWVVGNGQQIPFPDGCADIVMSIGSLEHYDEPTQGVRELARILKADGRACILLPNSFGLLGNIRYVNREGEVFDDGQPLQRYATRRTWTTMLARGGLAVDHIVPFGDITLPRTWRDRIWMAARPQKFVKAGLAALAPLNLANHFIFLCHRASGVDARYYPMLPYQ